MEERLEKPQLLDVNDVATIAACSPQTVRRLADAGKMPLPVKLGRLRRWPRVAIEEWIAEGCPKLERGRR